MRFREESYNSRLDTPGRTFFFDVKKPAGQPRQLVITQSRKTDNVRVRERLFVYEEDIASFVSEFMKAVEAMSTSEPRENNPRKVIPHRPPSSSALQEDRFADIRAGSPRAYEPWTAEEEETLILLAASGSTTSELAKRLQRQPGAIRSRLRRLAEIPSTIP